LASSREIGGTGTVNVTSSLIAPMLPTGSAIATAKSGSHFPAAQEIRELVAPFPLELDDKGFVRLERGKYEKPNRAPGLEHWTVTGVLRQERPLTFATRLQAGARTMAVREQSDFHAAYGRPGGINALSATATVVRLRRIRHGP